MKTTKNKWIAIYDYSEVFNSIKSKYIKERPDDEHLINCIEYSNDLHESLQGLDPSSVDIEINNFILEEFPKIEDEYIMDRIYLDFDI